MLLWFFGGIILYPLLGCLAFAAISMRVKDFRAWVLSNPLSPSLVLWFWPIVAASYFIDWLPTSCRGPRK